MHDSSSKLEVVMGLDTLLGDGLGDALRITSLKLAREEISKPAFKKWHDTTHEKQPDAPTGSPKADARTFANGTRIEAIVDEVLQVFRHSDLSHELVLVTVHARKGTNVRKDVLKGIRELEGVNIAKPVLDMGIDDELRQAQNFSTQVKSVSETGLLAFFCGQRPIKSIFKKRQRRRIGITYFTGFKFIL
jgi:hypothetical protein